MGLLIIIIALIIALLTLIPLLIIMGVAMYHSAKISLKDAWKLYLKKSIAKPIFQALAIAQKNNLPISLEQIEAHWLASGKPVKLMNVLASHPKNQEVTFESLSVIDLAGKDIEQAISSSQIIHEIHIKGYPLNLFKLDYHANYKLGLYSVFHEHGSKNFENKIVKKLDSFSSSWDSNDPIYTKNFIQTNILTTEYWEKILHTQLINHSLDISIKD